MAAFLIRRKLSRPRVSAPFFVREGLREALAEGLRPDRRLTLVSAGPGYGKTSTVADYVAQSSLPSAWLNLDPYDRDLEPFFTYLVRGLEANWPGYESHALALLQSAADKRQAIPAAAGALCEELAEWGQEGVIVVLDDFHEVEESPAIVEAMQVLVDYLPDNAQLIAISRAVPPLRLGQLRARQQLVELGVEQLRLAHDEIGALIKALSGRAPDTVEIERLSRLTEGWAASVVMAAQSRSQASSHTGSADGATLAGNDLIFEYLAQEVFDGLDPESQTFMLDSSLLTTVDPEICRRALDLKDAARHIEHLRRRNLLLGREREGTIEYHYHPILRAFLRERFRRIASSERARELRVAAGSFLEESAPDDALDLYLDGELWSVAEALLGRMLRPAYLDRGRHDALMHVLDRFPAEWREAAPWVLVAEGELLRLRGEFDQALARLESAEQRAKDAGNRSAQGQALALQAACLGSQGDPRLAERARAALEVLPDDDATGLALAHNALGLALQATDPDEALRHLESALDHYRRTGDAAGRIKVLHNLGLLHTRRGAFDQALAMYGEALRQAEEAGRLAPPATYGNLANVQIYQGEFGEAWSTAAKGLDLAQRLGYRREEGWSFLTLSEAAKGGGDLIKAASYAEDARSAAIALGDRALEAQAVAALAEVALQGGSPARAWELLGQAIAIRDLPAGDAGLVDLKIPAGRVLLEDGKAAEAVRTLKGVRDALEGSQQVYRQALVQLILARAYAAAGSAAEAEAARERGRALCQAHNFAYLLAAEDRPAGERPGARAAAATEAETRVPAPALAVPDLEIRCFGTFAAFRQGEAIAGKQWQGHKTKLILAYLLMNRQGVSRDQLAEVLYGEELVSRSAILMLLSRLRQALEPDLAKNSPSRFIQFRDGRYSFNFGTKYRVDTEDFEFRLREAKQAKGAARIALAEQALEIYTGRYLSDLPGEVWVTGAQEHFHLQAMRAYDEVLAHYLEAEDYEAVMLWADRCLQRDPCAESAHQAKMKALLSQGNRQGAIRHFQQMEQVLERELGIEPADDTRELYERILAGTLG